jgi:hypothetical protein
MRLWYLPFAETGPLAMLWVDANTKTVIKVVVIAVKILFFTVIPIFYSLTQE